MSSNKNTKMLDNQQKSIYWHGFHKDYRSWKFHLITVNNNRGPKTQTNRCRFRLDFFIEEIGFLNEYPRDSSVSRGSVKLLQQDGTPSSHNCKQNWIHVEYTFMFMYICHLPKIFHEIRHFHVNKQTHDKDVRFMLCNFRRCRPLNGW